MWHWRTHAFRNFARMPSTAKCSAGKDALLKTPRKRVANFTADEKALLAQLIKKYPVVESKLTDGKVVAKKKTAWDSITVEFNCNAHVHKRDSITLKRAWDNMKAFTRKARATERGSLMRTGGGPSVPPPPPTQGAIISMVEEAAPVIICEIENPFDSDGIVLNSVINNSQDISDLTKSSSVIMDIIDDDKDNCGMKVTASISVIDMTEPQEIKQDDKTALEDDEGGVTIDLPEHQLCRKTTDYIKREAVLRIKLLEAKKKMEMQILKANLETAEIKRRAAVLEEEKNIILLEKAKIELEELKKKL